MFFHKEGIDIFGYLHPLSQKTSSGKIIAGLNLAQLIVVGAGVKLSYDLSQIIPKLPFNNYLAAHIHHMIPFFIALIAILAKESKTGMPIALYIYNLILFKLRKKVYVWRRI